MQVENAEGCSPTEPGCGVRRGVEVENMAIVRAHVVVLHSVLLLLHLVHRLGAGLAWLALFCGCERGLRHRLHLRLVGALLFARALDRTRAGACQREGTLFKEDFCFLPTDSGL